MRLDDLTIVLPTRNEQQNILSFLRGLPSCLPLIVVDASEDDTPDLIHANRIEHTVVLRRPGNVTQARQWGAEAAQTRWLLFTDADVTFAPGYFDQLQQYRGYNVIYGPKLSLNEFASYYRWFARGQHLSHRLGIPAASGSNLLIERHAFQMAGGFDVRLSCNEDSEIVWRIKRLGYPTYFDPKLVVYAGDHRRLQAGLARKTAHSLARCLLLYSGLIPHRWRSHDWGYWSPARQTDDAGYQASAKG